MFKLIDTFKIINGSIFLRSECLPPSINRTYGSGAGGQFFQTSIAKTWKSQFKTELFFLQKQFAPDIPMFVHTPLAIYIEWYFKNFSSDVDNRTKILFDSMEGVVYDNDKCIALNMAHKFLATKNNYGGICGTNICETPSPEPDKNMPPICPGKRGNKKGTPVQSAANLETLLLTNNVLEKINKQIIQETEIIENLTNIEENSTTIAHKKKTKPSKFLEPATLVTNATRGGGDNSNEKNILKAKLKTKSNAELKDISATPTNILAINTLSGDTDKYETSTDKSTQKTKEFFQLMIVPLQNKIVILNYLTTVKWVITGTTKITTKIENQNPEKLFQYFCCQPTFP